MMEAQVLGPGFFRTTLEEIVIVSGFFTSVFLAMGRQDGSFGRRFHNFFLLLIACLSYKRST
jgi:hypothetical protein